MRRDLAGVQIRLREAGTTVRHAGEAGIDAARQAAAVAGERIGQIADAASERLGEAAGAAQERLGEGMVEARRAAMGAGRWLLRLPTLARNGVRRGREVAEGVGVRAITSMIDAGTRALAIASQLVAELAPRQRVDRDALERLVTELLGWENLGAEALDRTAAEVEDTSIRIQLVRCKLHTIRHGEILAQLLRDFGGRVPAEEQTLPPPAPSHTPAHGPAAARHGLARALTVSVQGVEGWRALAQIGARAEPDRVADAVTRAVSAAGREPQDQTEFLRRALLQETLRSVFLRPGSHAPRG